MKQIYALIFCPLLLLASQRDLDNAQRLNLNKHAQSIRFIQNKKQWSPEVKFLSQINGQQIWFTDKGIRTSAYKIIDKSPTGNDFKEPNPSLEMIDSSFAIGHVWDMIFVNQEPKARFEGASKLKEYHNYFLGNDSSKWSSNVALYSQLWYRNVYKGIDVKYYANEQGEMEYDFVIAPNADYHKIKLNYRGLEGLRISASGDLFLKTKLIGELLVSKPIAYQIVNNQKVPVPVKYALEGNNISFKILGNYNPNIELVIDPTLRYSTFLCNSFSNNWNYTSGIDVNAVGEAVVTGTTYNPNFPVTTGAFQTTLSGSYDAFILQLNALGTNVNFSTFLGGTLQDYSRGALYDNAYNIVLTGQTYSTNFPILGGLSSSLAGNYDVYISKLNSTGTALIFSSYFGGANQDYPSGLALDNLNDIYLCGSTYSTNFPITGGVIKTSITGTNTFDCFVAKINNTCTSLLYSSYLGGSNWDYAACLRIDKNKNAYICGYTASSDYPVTTGAYDVTYSASYDGFITKINTTATTIIFSTFLGGSSVDFMNSLALD
ncbi:MAG: SBBP repeat-containing protein, partial [Chitinophagales bacterium]|nr:SBBP repeat-containing protein [Chitinophagales bacterium]